MAKIALRAYNREIETLIDHGQIEEAIAHCKYILRFFPKHIETYRLLGKAYIESQRYSEAADILQRILSVLPDDFIAQVGMSIIREDENNLDAAIFHMEHAHEIQPSNAAVQDELRRLYGRRDGVEPPRLRLTRGALVRLYARGDLYRQAIAEIRAALAEDPNRFDLEVVLARMYYLLGQKVEAMDVASRLVAKLPYCMEANRILAEILPSTARAEDAKIYQAHVFALDPYLAYVSTNAPTVNLVPDNAVTLDHLEFQPSAAGEEQPAWAQTAGITISSPEEATAIPDWLTPAPQAEPATGLPAPAAPPAAESPSEPAPAVSTGMPEWMQGAGWEAAAQGVQEKQPEEEEAAAPAELPDWLKEMAPQSESAQAPQESDQKIDWLDQMLPEAEGVQTRSLSPQEAEELGVTPADQETGTPALETQGSEPGTAAYEETVPAWLSFPEGANAESEPTAESTSAPELEQPAAEVTTGAVEAVPEIEQPATAIAALATELIPEVEQPAAEIPPVAAEAIPEVEQPAAEIPAVAAEAIPEVEQPAGEIPLVAAEAIPEDEQPAAEIPLVAAEAIPEVEQPAAEIPAAETPIEEVTKPVRVIPAAPAPAPEAAPQAEPDWNDLDAAMAWLEGLAAKQGADQATLSTTEAERPETPPEWVKQEQEKMAAEEPPVELAPVPTAEVEIMQSPETEAASSVPISEAANEVPVAEVTEFAAETPAPIPAEAEVRFPAPGAEESLPEPEVANLSVAEALEIQPTETPAVSAQAVSGEMDADAAFAWLESLAAQQGADEATLSTSKEERQAAPPSWVTEAGEPISEAPTAAPEPAASQPEVPIMQAPIPQVPPEELPLPEVSAAEVPSTVEEVTKPVSVGEWVQEVQEPIEVEKAPEKAPTPVEPKEEPLPAWLQGLDQPPAQTSPLATPAGMEDLPDWLKGFDTQPEAPAAPTPAESVPVSDWLQEQQIPVPPPVAPVQPPVQQPLPPQVSPVAAVPIPPSPTGLKGLSTSDNPIITQAQAQLETGQIDPALDLYNQVIAQGQDLDVVIQDLTAAGYRYPVEPSLWQTLGDAHMRNDQIQEALDAYTKAEELLR
jgi:tetratricopeptide (TPR) repeat protein